MSGQTSASSSKIQAPLYLGVHIELGLTCFRAVSLMDITVAPKGGWIYVNVASAANACNCTSGLVCGGISWTCFSGCILL